MSLPGSAAPPATDRRRDGFARRSGEAVVELLRRGITARDILTKEAFENAIAVVMAFGGSTNAVLHLLAIAHEADVKLTLDDFTRIGAEGAAPGRREAVRQARDERRRPHRRRAGRDEGAARRRSAARRLPDRHRPDDGREPGPHRPAGPRRQGAARAEQPDPPDRRHHDPARLARPRGRGGQVGGLRLRRVRRHRKGFRRRAGRDGRARGRHDHAGDVVVIRYEGPKGGPGMREMLAITGAIKGAGPRQGRAAADRRPVLRRHHRACASGTSRRRPSTAGRSRSCETATDPARRRQGHAGPAGRRGRIRVRARPVSSRCPRRTPPACWPSTPSWSARRRPAPSAASWSSAVVAPGRGRTTTSSRARRWARDRARPRVGVSSAGGPAIPRSAVDPHCR